MNSIIPTDLYSLIYHHADGFTRLRLHQVCRHFYKIKLPNTRLMNQIMDCMEKSRCISYKKAAMGKYDIILCNFDHILPSQLIDLFWHGPTDISSFDSYLYRYGITHSDFCEDIIKTKNYDFLAWIIRIYCNDKRHWLIVDQIGKLPVNDIIEIIKNVKVYSYKWLIDTICHNNAGSRREEIIITICEAIDIPHFFTDVVIGAINHNIHSIYDFLYNRDPQFFIATTIAENSVSAFKYIRRYKKDVNSALKERMAFVDVTRIEMIYCYLMDIMDPIMISSVAVKLIIIYLHKIQNALIDQEYREKNGYI